MAPEKTAMLKSLTQLDGQTTMLPNGAEPMSIVIKLCELGVLGETFVTLPAIFQARVGCDQ